RQAGTRKGVENALPVDIFGPPRISSYSVRPNLGARGREFKRKITNLTLTLRICRSMVISEFRAWLYKCRSSPGKEGQPCELRRSRHSGTRTFLTCCTFRT